MYRQNRNLGKRDARVSSMTLSDSSAARSRSSGSVLTNMTAKAPAVLPRNIAKKSSQNGAFTQELITRTGRDAPGKNCPLDGTVSQEYLRRRS